MAEPARPESAIARFRTATGAVVGAGFLVGDGLVVTCAHVVAAALGADEQHRPGGSVTLEFPVRGPLGTAHCTATVAGWTPTRADDRGDIAVLRLDGPVPDGVRPALLSPAPAPAGTEIDALGFPDGLAEQGLWARGRIRREQATGWLQLDSVPGGPRISPGFSGTPVFSEQAGGVIGMVVAVVRDAEQTTTFLNPARTLVAEHPELHDAQSSPYRGLAAFSEQDGPYFRGRDELIAAALARAATHPLLVLSGPSGSGKSSLARAGLLPRLREQGRTVSTVRVLPGEPAEALLDRITGPAPEDRAGHAVLVDQFEEADPDTARTLAGHLHRMAEAAGMRPDGAPRLLIVLTLRGRQLDAVATGETATAMQAGLVLVPPMTEEQLREAVTPPGAVFEPGLVGRLVTDAGAEPGTLPLLEFTLDRLWDRRELGVLTHAGYDGLGGVAGAMARYADGAVERDPVRARRLLVLLAGPDDDGIFRRRPLRWADLPATLHPTLDRLAAGRLVVAGPGPDGEPVVELAHESLIRAWPRLRDWLEQDREFRTWLEETRRSARRWLAADREPEALLRGAALAAAVRWSEARAADLGPDEEGFLRASTAQDRRRARRGRSVTAALVVLTLLAGTFALLAQQQTGELREQLRRAASRQLADDSERFRRSEPAKALQLALAAWHADQTPEAYGALLTQYAGLQPVERLLQNLTNRPGAAIESVSASRDGSVMMVTDETGGWGVWRFTPAGPRRVTLAPGPRREVGGTVRVSPSGRYFAYANALGGVFIRDIARPDRPQLDLAPSGPDVSTDTKVVRSVQFAPDESGLVVLRTDYAGREPEVRLWDLPSGRAVRDLSRIDAPAAPSQVSFGPEPGSLLVTGNAGVDSYDIATGRRLRHFGQVDNGRPLVAAGGSLLVSCGNSEKVIVRDLRTGRQLRSIPVQSCSSFVFDATGDFGTLLRTTFERTDTSASLIVVDPRTGDTHSLPVPPRNPDSGFESVGTLTVTRDTDGVPTALMAAGSQVYRVPLGPVVRLGNDDSSGLDFDVVRETVPTPDGLHRVVLDVRNGRITVAETRSGREVAAVSARARTLAATFHGVWRMVTSDSSRLLTAHHGELVVYSLPDLTVERRLPLPVPPDLGGPPADDGVFQDWAASVVPVEPQEAIVLYAGALTRWNLATGERIGEPAVLRAGEIQARRRRAAQLAFASGGRPEHPDQVAVVLPGSVQVWSVARRGPVASFAVDAAGTANATLFSPDGSQLAVREQRGALQSWWVDNPQRLPATIPTGISADLLGFTSGEGNYLLTVDSGSGDGAQVWHLGTARRVASVTAPTGSTYNLAGDELTILADGFTRRLRLDPHLWFRSLCALASRPFTAEETLLLQERAAPLTPPCPGS